jgi:type II secretory pathway pseudopilin PulG
MHCARSRNGGFTLVDLAITVVIVGLLAAFAVPRFLALVEREKASEAFDFANTVHSAQERYQARHGRFADTLTKLDTLPRAPDYFSVSSIMVPVSATSLKTGWELTITRTKSSGGFAPYTVVWTHDGFDAEQSTISNDVNLFELAES